MCCVCLYIFGLEEYAFQSSGRLLGDYQEIIASSDCVFVRSVVHCNDDKL